MRITSVRSEDIIRAQQFESGDRVLPPVLKDQVVRVLSCSALADILWPQQQPMNARQQNALAELLDEKNPKSTLFAELKLAEIKDIVVSQIQFDQISEGTMVCFVSLSLQFAHTFGAHFARLECCFLR